MSTVGLSRRTAAAWGGLCLLLMGLQAQPSPSAAMAKRFREDDLLNYWVYQDLNAGLAKARQTGKPLLIVFR